MLGSGEHDGATTAAAVTPPLHQYAEAKVCSKIFAHYGIDTTRHNALAWIADDIVLMSAGKFVLFVNVHTGEMSSQDGPSDGGVGVVGVHPSRSFYVVGERAPVTPQLHIYAWPQRTHVHTFSGDGATVGFAACAFDAAGTRLATVASYPDYTLAVWDWQTRALLLRSKCSGSDVYTVGFSMFDHSLLVTGGAGHVKFWTMAQTFTGLKLQGTLGKFDRLEISNITGFVVLPDGKVLTGSESGCLLLWEGDLVKCCFVRAIVRKDEASLGDGIDIVDESVALVEMTATTPTPAVASGGMGLLPQSHAFQPCHAGAINVVALVHDGLTVVTAGDDGYLRYWSREELEVAEGEGLPPLYAPRCLLEVCVGADAAGLRSMTLCQERMAWALLTHDGAILTSPLPPRGEVEAGQAPPRPISPPALSFNGGCIRSSAISARDHTILIGGDDGVLRLVDYVQGCELLQMKWRHPNHVGGAGSAPLTVLQYLRTDPSQNTFIAGFEDGTLRLMRRDAHFALLGEWKPHKRGLFAIAVSTKEDRLCSLARDGTLFFFRVAPDLQSLTPLGFCQTPLADPLCAAWDEAGEAGGCLVGYETGQVLAVAAPSPDCFTSSAGAAGEEHSFEFTCSYTLLGLRQRRLPPPTPNNATALVDDTEDLLQVKDNGPWAVTLLQRLPSGALAVGMRKEELLYTYRGAVRYPGILQLPPLPPTGIEPPNYVEEPIDNLCYRDCVPYGAYVSVRQSTLLVTCAGSRIVLRDLSHLDRVALAGSAHDSTSGTVTGAFLSFDDTMIVTTATDGLVVAQLRDGYPAPTADTARPLTAPPPVAEATVVPQAMLSLEEQRAADARARVEAARQARLQHVLETLRNIHTEYAALLDTNHALPPHLQLSESETELDATIKQRLAQEKARRVAEARREFLVDTARADTLTRKLRNRFIDNLLCDRFLLHAFSRAFSVASFRTADPTEAFARLEHEIAELAPSDSEPDSPSDKDGDGGADEATDVEERSGARRPRRGCGAGAAQGDVRGSQPHDADGSDDEPALAGPQGQERGAMGSSVKHHLTKLDERRRERRLRREGYEMLLSRKPDSAQEDAALAASVQDDLRRRGECVLRTDPNYRGLQEHRPSAAAKLQRMITLERRLIEMRTAFNERLLQLREEKRGCVARVNALRTRMAAIDKELGERNADTDPCRLQHDEGTTAQLFAITRDGLDAFERQKKLERTREEEARKAQRGFGADLIGMHAMGAANEADARGSFGDETHRDAHCASASATRGQSRTSRAFSRLERSSRQSTAFLAVNRERIDAELRVKLENIKPSELEEEERAMRRAELRAERARLGSEVRRIVDGFDHTLEHALHERAALDADLCHADAHLVLLFREYQTLLIYRKRDQELRHGLRSIRQRRDELRRSMQSTRHERTAAETVCTGLQDKLKGNKHVAEEFIAQSFPSDQVPYLLRVFHRRLKRRRLSAANSEDDDITSEDEDEEDDVEDDLGEELCPANCDPAAWQTLLDFRRTRLDLTDALTEARLRLGQFGKSLEAGEEEAAALAAELKVARQKIDDLETEKRRELNNIHTAVSLRCDQVKCLTEDRLCPAEMMEQPVLVIAEDELMRLRCRIRELAAEKQLRRQQINDMAAMLQAAQTERAAAQKVHEEWEARVEEVMMLKFGQRVDLEMLESCGSSWRLELKKEELRQLELRLEREVRAAENKLAELRDELQSRLVQNTHLLQTLGDYESDRQVVEAALSSATLKTVQRYRGVHVATQQDRNHLRELIAAQQEEIDALSAEIMMLRQKGGHAYYPVP